MAGEGFKIQLRGNFKFGESEGEAIAYSRDLSQLVINLGSNTVTLPGNYADPQARTEPTTDTATVTVTFAKNLDDPTGLHAELLNAYQNLEGKRLYFEGTWGPGAVSATNPLWKGYVRITTLDVGTEVGGIRQQSVTWPAEDIVGPLVSES